MCTVPAETGECGCNSKSCDIGRIKKCQFSIEIDESQDIDYEVENDTIENAYKNCKYKSNHNKYISGDRFAHNDHPFHQDSHVIARNYLPRSYNRRSHYDMVHCLFDRTVLVQRTGKLKSYASGRIGGISGQDIFVYTVAHHVKFAKSSDLTCRLDYNKSDSPEVYLTVDEYDVISSSDDICVLKCSTGDAALFNNIKQRLDAFRSRCHGQYEKMKKKEKRCGRWSMSEWALSNLVVVISHPHAGPKKISLGERYSGGSGERGQGAMTYYYTAPTCSGCSGAPVFVFGCPTWDMMLVHRGKLHMINDSSSKRDDSSFKNDTSTDSTLKNDTSKDSTFQKDTSHDSKFQSDINHGSTFQQDTSRESISQKDTSHDTLSKKDTVDDSKQITMNVSS